MTYLLPVASLGVSLFAIITSPWPTTDELFPTYQDQQREQFIEFVDYLEPHTIANKAK
jgi:hypothetical protein